MVFDIPDIELVVVIRAIWIKKFTGNAPMVCTYRSQPAIGERVESLEVRKGRAPSSVGPYDCHEAGPPADASSEWVIFPIILFCFFLINCSYGVRRSGLMMWENVKFLSKIKLADVVNGAPE